MVPGTSDSSTRALPETPRRLSAGGSAEDDILPTRQLTQLQLVWIRFRRHRLAMIGSGILLFMVLMAIFAPIIAPENIYDPNAVDVFGTPDQAPTLASGLRYIFGSDSGNHSVLSEVIYGARYSLLIGFTASILTTIIGMILGGISGYFGGWMDTVLMRTVDIFLTLPFLPLLFVAAAIFGGGHTSPVLVIAIFTFFGWAYIARLVRGLFLSLRTMEYAEAARAVGVPTSRIIMRHLLPNTLRPILVATTLGVAGIITGEAAIDFLGIGLQYPDTSWGSVLAFAQEEQFQHWWVTVFPGMFLVITLVAVNFLGDGLSDALDVRSR
jgi:ABC-type dipeptide/oligopeptide/nickel transport system permease subunit